MALNLMAIARRLLTLVSAFLSPSAVPPTCRAIRCTFAGGQQRERIWIAFAGGQRLHGKPGESKKRLVKRWQDLPARITSLVPYRGLHRPSEAAMTIACDALDASGTAGP